ncbi:hypothetical protein K402DRAFT_462331 [Aulographum hederae CBS 113979]|uniref:EthD domain-containing protein n=1 Tax=Aulographum hederae CBS 113979 TaxID=1176131 RepID=A0A6G1H463_9PEZI|nr:hypothetical protein K402DRAFT_462331 [Aulographum hederae CBS 113979]
MATGKYLKVSLFLTKLPNITNEKFHSHWKGTHADLALANSRFQQVVKKYNQAHTSPELKSQASDFKIPVLEFDGVAEVWVETLEDWVALASDEEFKAIIVPDEKNFIQHPITVMLSYDNLVIPEK